MPGSNSTLAYIQLPGILACTHPRSKCELQIIRAECVVVNGRIKCLVEKFWVPEQVLGHTQPETEKLQHVSMMTSQEGHSHG